MTTPSEAMELIKAGTKTDLDVWITSPDQIVPICRALEEAPAVTFFRFEQADFREVGIEAVLRVLEKNDSLRQLVFLNCMIGDENAKALARVIGNLTLLNITTSAGIGEEGREALRTAAESSLNIQLLRVNSMLIDREDETAEINRGAVQGLVERARGVFPPTRDDIEQIRKSLPLFIEKLLEKREVSDMDVTRLLVRIQNHAVYKGIEFPIPLFHDRLATHMDLPRQIVPDRPAFTRDSLSAAFNAGEWTGRLREMRALWACVPPSLQERLDFVEALATAQKRTLKARPRRRHLFPVDPT